MAKAPYKDFSNYMLRHYVKTPETEIYTEIERLNWQAAKAALEELGERHKEIVLNVLSSAKPLRESVYNCHQETGASEPEIWSVIKKVHRRVAELRGLI